MPDVDTSRAVTLEHWLAQHELTPLKFIALMLTGDAPTVANVAGELLVFNEETRHWRARQVVRTKRALTTEYLR